MKQVQEILMWGVWALCDRIFVVEYVYLSVTWPRLEVKNGHQNDICLNEIGQCSQNTKINLSSWVTTLRGPMWSLKEKHYNLQFDLLDLEMHLYSDVESWNNNLCDLQLLTRWDNCWSNPTIKIVVELELPTIGPHTVDQQECMIHLNLKLGLSRSKLFKQKDFC